MPLRLADVGEHPRSYGFPPGHPPMGNFLGVPIVIRGQAWGNLYLTEKPGGDFDEADEQTGSGARRVDGDRGRQRPPLRRCRRAARQPRAGRTRARGDDRDHPRRGRRDRPRPDPRDDRQARPGTGRGTLAADPARGRRRAAGHRRGGEFENHSDLRLTGRGFGARSGLPVAATQPRSRDLDAALPVRTRRPRNGGESLLVPLVFRGESVGRARSARPACRRIRVRPRERAGARVLRGQRGDRRRHRSVGRQGQRAATASKRPSASVAAGLASFTTSPCRAWRGLRVMLSAARRGGEPGDVDGLLSRRRSSRSTARSRRCAA